MLPVPVHTATLLNTDYKVHMHNYSTDHTMVEKQFNTRASRQPGGENTPEGTSSYNSIYCHIVTLAVK